MLDRHQFIQGKDLLISDKLRFINYQTLQAKDCFLLHKLSLDQFIRTAKMVLV
jgi:hypothetical protein